MSTSKSDKSALLVGVGGLGCPAAIVLAEAGIGRLLLADDDVVELSNLHRQILFDDADVGRDKLDVAARALAGRGYRTSIELVRSRFLPDNARALVREVDVIVEGADNFATKFLAADVAMLEGRPVVHGAAIRWRATVWAISPHGRPCYRCLFEDLPDAAAQPNCAEAGVMGPVVGIGGALMADLALRALAGDSAVFGAVHTYDGKEDRLRRVPVGARPGCALCGRDRTIFDIDESRYTDNTCAA
jgi:adenylyltransferase/sulfurtransferase